LAVQNYEKALELDPKNRGAGGRDQNLGRQIDRILVEVFVVKRLRNLERLPLFQIQRLCH
jgi:hypothetical protein